MKVATLVRLLSLTVLSCLPCSGWSQGSPIHSLPDGAVEQAAMVAPNVGWAFSFPRPEKGDESNLLWWTTDGGAHWQIITPPMSKSEIVISVSFVNTLDGWALLEDISQEPDAFQFDLASTTSAGAKWEVHHLITPRLRSNDMRSGFADGLVAFVDPLHGWMYLTADEPNLMITSDGGRSWQPAQSMKMPMDSARLVPVTPLVAWLRDASFHGLYVTRDGAKTWQTVRLPPPDALANRSATGICKDSDTIYSDPIFQDSNHGFEAVTYGYSKLCGLSAAVLFETLDGGISWQVESLHGDLSPNLSRPVSSTVVDSNWLIARQPFAGLPMVTILHPGEWQNGMVATGVGYNANLKMSFTNSDRGWVLMNGALLATQDGGASWSNVTPDRDQRTFKPARLPGAR